MSKTSVAFENEIVKMVNNHIEEPLPPILPDWMINEGIIPGAKIISVNRIGDRNKDNKTDVIKNMLFSKEVSNYCYQFVSNL